MFVSVLTDQVIKRGSLRKKSLLIYAVHTVKSNMGHMDLGHVCLHCELSLIFDSEKAFVIVILQPAGTKLNSLSDREENMSS